MPVYFMALDDDQPARYRASRGFVESCKRRSKTSRTLTFASNTGSPSGRYCLKTKQRLLDVLWCPTGVQKNAFRLVYQQARLTLELNFDLTEAIDITNIMSVIQIEFLSCYGRLEP